jgi:hypothetical protein
MIACFSGFLWKFMAAVSGILGGMYPVLAWAHTELSMLLKHVYGCPVVPTAMCSKQGGVWNLITELLPCWVFDLKSKIVFSSLRVGYARLLSRSLSENLERGVGPIGARHAS